MRGIDCFVNLRNLVGGQYTELLMGQHFFRNQRSLIQILLLKSSSFEMIALFWSTIDEKLQSDIWESLMLQKKTTDSNEIKTDLSNLTKKVSFDIIVWYSLYHGV